MPRPPRVLLLALVLAAATGCGGPTGSSGAQDGPDPVAVVRAAAASTTDAGSSRFALTSRTVVQGRPLEIVGSGVFDFTAREGTLELTLPVGKVEQRVVDGSVYLALSQQPGTFYELSLDEVQGTSLGGSTDPGASFASLQAATDEVTVVGEEEVRGEGTTHYRGALDVQEALSTLTGTARQVAAATIGRAGVDEVPFDAWIDDEGRLRKYVQVLQVPAGPGTGGQPVQSTTTLELFDYGTDVDVQEPPASAVQDGAPLLEALKGASPAGG